MRSRAIAVVLLSAVALPGAASAQHAPNEGITLIVGAGPGWARVSCDICQTSRDLGPSAFLRGDRAVRPGVRIGGEATGWTNQVGEERESMGALMAVLVHHPRQGPLYLKGGLGYVGYRAGDDITMNALGVQLGTGYEVRVRSLALSGFINVVASAFGALESGGATVAEGVGTTLLQLGLAMDVR